MTIIKELDALHVNGEEYKFPAGEGDMKYADFSLVEKTGATVTLDLFSEIEPSANFTVNAPSTIKEGQMYILRVTTGATPYTMTLGTGITNPYSESTTLLANTVHQFGFLAIDGDLELQPSVTQSGGGEWGTITGTLSNQTDLQTALNAKADASDLNTKTFTLSSTSDLTTAQAAYDWYLEGKTPIIRYYNQYYYLRNIYSSNIRFYRIWEGIFNVNATSGFQDNGAIVFNISNNNVTSISSTSTGTSFTTVDGKEIASNGYLRVDYNYSNPYIPRYDGSPATKKYVDDNVVQKSATAPSSPTEGMVWYDTTNDVLKVYDGTNWNVTGKEYNAGSGIGIGTEHSDMQGPAPDGFHVPTYNEWASLCGILTTTFGLASTDTTMKAYLKMPCAGYRGFSSSNVGNQGSNGWYSSSTGINSNFARSLIFGSNYIMPGNSSYYAYGLPVRCFKDSPVIPDSGWTTLYDGSSVATNAGVFYNSTLGLISVSGDGTTWITIQDKNLGATTVYNDGDTLSEDNCGKYYQWGNNYGFPFNGSVTTSSTKVDASNYGPGNYYSSSTFITTSSPNGNWSSVQNDNLWGGVSQGIWVGGDGNTIVNTGVLSVNGQTGNVTIVSGVDKSWVTKTVSSGEIELGIRTLVNNPSSNFTLTKPATLIDGEEYILRVNNGSTARTITLGTGFTNPHNINLTLSTDATDQLVFLSINNSLELQPLITINY